LTGKNIRSVFAVARRYVRTGNRLQRARRECGTTRSDVHWTLSPSSWELNFEISDQQEVSEFLFTDLETQRMAETDTSEDELRKAVRRAATPESRVLVAAVDCGLLTGRDADRFVKRGLI
jgi:hypothetical protein